jgi:hypothetical protein
VHEERDEAGRLRRVEFYETERCYRAVRGEDAGGWAVTVDGHPLGELPAEEGDTGTGIRARVLARVNEHGS